LRRAEDGSGDVCIDLGGELGDSRILQMLTRISRTEKDKIMIHLSQPKVAIPTLVWKRRAGRLRMLRFASEFGSQNYVGDGVVGMALPPLHAKRVVGQMYSVGSYFSLFVLTDQSESERSATTYHEFSHIAFGFGHPSALWEVQHEAKRNAALRERLAMSPFDGVQHAHGFRSPEWRIADLGRGVPKRGMFSRVPHQLRPTKRTHVGNRRNWFLVHCARGARRTYFLAGRGLRGRRHFGFAGWRRLLR
jgi:hypothetical protein